MVNGQVVPKPPSRVSADLSLSGWNCTSGRVFTSRPSRARDLVTMVDGGPTPGRSKRASDRFPEALGWNPTCRTDRCDLRYGLDQSPFLLPAISSNVLLRKIWAVGRS